MKRLVLFISFFTLSILSTSISAQNNSRISGIIFDEKGGDPVIQASVRILSARDSSYITGAVTNEAGRFQATVPYGRYIINISYLGYASQHINVNANKENVSIGKINLKEDAILLKEAVVIGKAVEIMVKGDTIEYNADSYKVQESAVLEDLMKKMPGVEIDSDGKITVNGKEVNKILVDGKEFFSDDPKIASKNLPAAMVNKLQVVDRKSDMAMMTGFDDGNEETVINLTIKPGMKEGAFGNAYAGYGSKDRYETNAMISYMRDNHQLTALGGTNNTNNAGFSDFASSSFGGGRPPRGLNFGNKNGTMTSTNGGINFASETSPRFKWGGNARYGSVDNDVRSDSHTQKLKLEGGEDLFETEKSWGTNKSYNTGANLRFEWAPDSMTQFIITPNLQYNKNKKWENSELLTTGENPIDSLSWGDSEYFSDGTGIVLNGTVDFSRKLNNEGRVISASISGGLNNMESDGINKATTHQIGGSTECLDQIIKSENNNHNWRAFASYVEPIGRNNFLQLTYSFRKNHSKSDKLTYLADGITIDSAFTRLTKNDFTNQEINLNFKSVREKFNYTIGFGIQPSSSRTETIGADTIKTNVTNFSPNAQFNYIWSRNSNLRISYSGTTNQPTANQLSVAKDQTNSNNVISGNPNLKPSFENRLSIRYRNFNPEQASAFMIFGRFSYVLDDIVNVSTYQGAKTFTTYDNVDGNFSGNLRIIFNTPLKFNKKFSVNSMSFGSYSQNKGWVDSVMNVAKNFRFQESLGIEYRSDLFDAGLRGNFTYNNIKNTSRAGQNNFSYGGNFNTTIYLPYDFTVESDINFTANSGYSDGFNQNEWLWNASLSKSIFKNKAGTLRFKIYDILQDRNNITRTSTQSEIRDVATNTINSYFMFHFVYKFQLFKGGLKQTDMENGMRQRGRGMGGGRPPHAM